MDELWSRIHGLTPEPLLLIENNPGKNQFPRPGLSFLSLNTQSRKCIRHQKFIQLQVLEVEGPTAEYVEGGGFAFGIL